MATTTASTPFGNIGGFTFPAKRLRPERIMPKGQQVAKIQQYLSNRGADIDVLDLVEDWVDPTVLYEINKAEIVSRVGFATLKKPPSNKELAEMQCTSLHNECQEDGLELCQVACETCGDDASCNKVNKLEKEIKKHGRELTHFERDEIEREKESKRTLKKPKFTKGQTVKCRDGYSCGFSISKITEVKQYPDYVMYGIAGKSQGFVDEGWIEGGKIKKPKEVKVNMKELNKKFKHHSWWKGQGLTKQEVLDKMAESGDFYIGKKPKPSKFQSDNLFDDTLYDDIIKYSGREGGTYRISPVEKKYFLNRKEHYTKLREAENARIRADPKYQLQKQKEEEQDLVRNVAYAKRESESAKNDNDTHRIEYWAKAIQEKEQQLIDFHTRTTKKEPSEATKTPKKLSKYVMFKGVKKHRMRCPICGRAAPDNFCMVHSDVDSLDLETSKKAQELTTELMKARKEWLEKQKEEKKEIATPKTTKKEVVKPTKPIPKPLSKKQATEIHQKVLTKEQLKQIQTSGETHIQIGGSKEQVTNQHFKPRSNTVYWWKKDGVVYLKIIRDEPETNQEPQPFKRYLIKHPDNTYHQAKATRPIKIQELKKRYIGCTVYELHKNEWVKLFGSGVRTLKKDKIIKGLNASGKEVKDLAGDANASKSYAYQVLKKSRKARIAGRKDLRYRN